MYRSRSSTAGTIETIVMAEPTPAVEDAPVPVMELETPITIAVIEPEPSYFPPSSPLADIYANLDLAASFSPPLLAGPKDIFDLSAFPEAQFGDDLPSWESFAGLTPAVPVPDVSPTPAAVPSAHTADDEAMLVNDEWAMDGVWPSGVAISYHYSEFDIVVDTSADMAAAERDRIAWVKQCRASEIEADEEEIPGLVLPPPTSSPAFRCASFEWKTLDLGLPGSSLYSRPLPAVTRIAVTVGHRHQRMCTIRMIQRRLRCTADSMMASQRSLRCLRIPSQLRRLMPYWSTWWETWISADRRVLVHWSIGSQM
ncbi:hypothetical protein CPB85DRAFT_124004 [Mucidula mucida]|nr:hypothetical protein CPB85DRAFT_124004 [Mucidula mucida]